ncbi:MAG: type IV pilus modification PilV family protein [Acidobacteriota bacterium]
MELRHATPDTRHATPGAAGFTLLEIIVALAILSLGLGAAMQIFSGGLKNIHRIDMAHQAMRHAENVMNEMLSDQHIREPREFSDVLDENFSYTAAVDYWEEPDEQLSIDVEDPAVYLLSVRVDIHFTSDPYGKIYRAVSLKTVPTDASRQQPGTPGTPADAIRQLFGGPP